MERTPRNIMALTVATLAVTAPAVAEAMLNQDQAAAAERAYAVAKDGRALANFKANITSSRTIGVEASVPDMTDVRPDLNRANVSRDLWMKIYLGKRLVGKRLLLDDALANGAHTEAAIRTTRKLACGKRVTAKVTEIADSPYAPGKVTSTRSTNFKVRCTTN